MKKTIVIVGSANWDVVNRVQHIPRPGETLISRGMMRNAGGKGANQAVAAGKLGGDVYLIGAVGEEEAGDAMLASLRSSGVHTEAVSRVADPTGTAYINVGDDGENCIIVLQGANARVDPAMLSAQDALIAGAGVVAAQMEVPAETVWQAMRRGREAGATTILNPSPMRPIPAEVLRNVDILIPNETEMEALLGKPLVIDERLCGYVKESGLGCVVLTLGDAGCCIIRPDSLTRLPCQRMEPVDTTGAGDTFLGALATALSEGETLEHAAEFAMRASAVTVTRMGAQQAMPFRSEIV